VVKWSLLMTSDECRESMFFKYRNLSLVVNSVNAVDTAYA